MLNFIIVAKPVQGCGAAQATVCANNNVIDTHALDPARFLYITEPQNIMGYRNTRAEGAIYLLDDSNDFNLLTTIPSRCFWITLYHSS